MKLFKPKNLQDTQKSQDFKRGDSGRFWMNSAQKKYIRINTQKYVLA